MAFQAQARKPAIEPTSGLSIDHVEIDKKTMFNFDQPKSRKPSSKKSFDNLQKNKTPESPSPTYREISSQDQENTDFPYFLLLIPILALPIIARFILKKKALKNHSYGHLKVIDGQKESSSQDHDDDNFKQAS